MAIPLSWEPAGTPVAVTSLMVNARVLELLAMLIPPVTLLTRLTLSIRPVPLAPDRKMPPLLPITFRQVSSKLCDPTAGLLVIAYPPALFRLNAETTLLLAMVTIFPGLLRKGIGP